MNEYALFVLSAIVSVVVNVLGRLRGRSEPSRILVVKLDHLGDVILATPAIRALRERHPRAVIDALVHPAATAAVAHHPAITNVFMYRSPRFARGGTADGPSRVREVALRGYDTIVELRGDERTLFLPFRAGARRRIDRGTVRLRNKALRALGRAPVLHEVETNLEIVRPLAGTSATRPQLEVDPGQAARVSLARTLEDRGIPADARLVVFHPGAAWRPRAWRPERFGAVADWILGHYDAQVVLVGSEDERDVEDLVRRSMREDRALAMTGSLTLEELTALLGRSALFIGNDSGPAHLAAACGVPSIVLFGPQDPRRFGPWSERTQVLHHPVACFPCRQTVCVMAEDPCVNRNEVADVIARAREVLGPPERVQAAARG
jgi:lipopolysaccharide heptosyltransferase II